MKNIFIVSFLSISFNTMALEAVIRSNKNAEVYYSKSYKYDRDHLLIIECNKTKSRKLRADDFVVLESENLCLRVDFYTQTEMLKMYISELKRDGAYAKVEINFPKNLDSNEEAILKSIIGSNNKIFVNYNKSSFSINTYVNKTQMKGVKEIADTVELQKTSSSGEFINLIRLDRDTLK